VVIATEAALAEVERPQIGTAIALGVDSLLQRPRGRAAEETVQALWALAVLAAGQNPKGRLIIETSNPDHHVIQAVVRGDHRYFASRELQARQEAGVPPFKSLVRVQVNGRPSEELIERLEHLPGTAVLGPSPGGSLGWQLLLKVNELEAMLDPLNDIVASSPQRVLVEVDVRDW
jgi:primosomal protein N' (replication factor Y)